MNLKCRISPWRGYGKGTFGNIIHFLYCYCGMSFAEEAVIEKDKVQCFDSKATFIICNDGYPVFLFTGKDAEWYNEQQQKLREEAIAALDGK